MKILFVQPTGDKRGHYGLWTSKLCQAIAMRGDDITLFTNKIYPEKYLNELPLFKTIELKQGKYRFDDYDQALENKSLLYWYGYFRNTYLIVKHAFKLCEKEKFDVVFLTDVEYLTASLLVKRYKRFLPPIIWHVQAANFSYDSYCGSAIKKLYKVFQRKIFKSTLSKEVKGFAVLGNFHKQTLPEQLKLQNHFPIEVIPDGADVNQVLIPQALARKNINLNYNGIVFLFFGMLRKDKDLAALIEAVSRLNHYEFKVLIVGAPIEWSKEELLALIKKFQVSEKIELKLDYIPDHDVSSYYSASDAVVFPYSETYTGGCGPLTKGASTYSKPVIVTDVADLGHIVNKSQNGFIAKACEPQYLAECMEQFIHLSSTSKEELSKKSAALAKQHSWDNVAKQFVAFCGDCHARTS